MATTYTQKTRLARPGPADRDWNIPLNANADAIDALAPVGGLCVATTEVPSATLNVQAAAGRYQRRDGTVGVFAGASSVTLAAGATTHVYLTDTGALTTSTTGLPTTSHVPLAVVVTGASTVTSVTDLRVVCGTVGADARPFLPTAGGTMADGAAIALGTASGLKIGTATTQKLGFWNATPVVRPGTYTQTYATNTRTLAAYTPAPATSAYAGAATGQAGTPYAQAADLNSLRSAYENLRGLRKLGLDPAYENRQPTTTRSLAGMPGSFDFDPYDVPSASPAATIRVYRYDPQAASGSQRSVVPNVVCERIRHAEGPQPPTAWFRYILDDTDPAARAPADFARLWPLGSAGPYVVREDDRLVVVATTPDGASRVLFDGFATSPEVDLSARAQRVGFMAQGVAARCWDRPIGGRLQRHADDPHDGATVAVQLPTRFNPDGKPNCTPDGYDVEQSQAAASFPVFLDADIDRDPDPRSYWTLGKFVRYILGVHNDQSYVLNPDFDRLDALLQSRGPAPGGAPLGSSGTAADVVVRDYDATNVPWPEALAAQLDLAGFGLRFITGDAGDGSPRSEVVVYRKDADAAGPARDLLLSKVGSILNSARCNVAALNLKRDSRSIINAVTVETAQRRVEASFVLAPGFHPTAGDEASSQRIRFLRANLGAATGEDRRRYRYYVADEAGDGHWDASSSSWSTAALDLIDLFPDDDDGPTYVKRLRPGSISLITRDDEGRPLRAQLALSRDYAGPSPGVWDGTGHWQPIAGGWQLLEDRLGIVVVAEDPESWAIGDYTGSDPQEPSRTLRGVTSQANPSAPNTRFTLRLTTVVEDDLMLPAQADVRPASPTSFERRRRVDARDHFTMETVAAGSLYNPEAEPIVVRDDTDRAVAWARQLRAAHEMPPTVGGATIPGLVTAYRVGDRIVRINDRDVGLQTNVGEAQGESLAYPVVTAVSWEFSGEGQATVIEISDADVERGG